MAREAEIYLRFTLNDDNIPEEILWEASEADVQDQKKCDAVFLSLWDREEKNTLTIDLWTRSMEVGEMNTHYYFTIMKMADTYEKATNNAEIAEKIRNFGNEFAQSVKEMIRKED